MKIEIRYLNTAELHRALDTFQNSMDTMSAMPKRIVANPEQLQLFIDKINLNRRKKQRAQLPNIEDWYELKFEFSVWGVPIVANCDIQKNILIFEK